MGEQLQALRARIDLIDGQIIALLAERFQTTQEVGILKATLQLQPVDANRESQQAARYAELASQHHLNPELVQRIFRCVIDEVVANHAAIATKKTG